MRLGFFTNAFKQFSLEYCAAALSELGYSGIELWCKGQHVTPYDGADRISHVKKLLRRNNLQLCALSAHLDFITGNKDLRSENVDKFRRVMDLAKKFGVDKVVTASGYLFDRHPTKAMEKNFIEAMKELGEHAKKKKLTIVLEPEPEKLLREPRQAVRFIEKLGMPVFKTCADLSHAVAIGMSVEEFISEMQEYLGHVHLDDGSSKLHPHRHMIPGEGDIDHRAVFEFLEEIGYRDWVSVELNQHVEYPRSAAQKTMEFLRREGLLEFFE